MRILQPIQLRRKAMMAFVLLALSQFVQADTDFSWAPFHRIGDAFPDVTLKDQNGKAVSLANMSGEKGYLVILSRSVDWCGFCKKQMIEISANSERFTAQGVNIVAITYDANEDAKKFHGQQSIQFPILQDVGSQFIMQLGILNNEHQPGDRFYGIPHPGIFLVDKNGVIQDRFAEQDYRLRPKLETLLEATAKLKGN